MSIGIELKLKSEYFADRLSHPLGSSVEESTSGVADDDAVFDELDESIRRQAERD